MRVSPPTYGNIGGAIINVVKIRNQLIALGLVPGSIPFSPAAPQPNPRHFMHFESRETSHKAEQGIEAGHWSMDWKCHCCCLCGLLVDSHSHCWLLQQPEFRAWCNNIQRSCEFNWGSLHSHQLNLWALFSFCPNDWLYGIRLPFWFTWLVP